MPRSFFASVLVLLMTSAADAATRAEKCEAAKLLAAGKYEICRLRVERKAVLKNVAPDFGKCTAKFNQRWSAAEAKWGADCPTLGDAASVGAQVEASTASLAAGISGSPLPGCGDGVLNGSEQCDGADLAGASCQTLGYTLPGGALACTPGCAFDASGCAAQRLPVSGQTTSFTADTNDGVMGNPVPVPDDGALQTGAALQYVDNLDGTITDLNTGLMWEKKCLDGGLHDRDARYSWSSATLETIWDWLGDVNAEGGTGFAGYSDWRIPNIKELQTIVDYGTHTPTASPVFNNGCVAGCSVTTCSCDGSAYMWTSTTWTQNTATAWVIYFTDGVEGTTAKDTLTEVRAVRGGL